MFFAPQSGLSVLMDVIKRFIVVLTILSHRNVYKFMTVDVQTRRNMFFW